jgi:hypothetical protein
MHVLPRRQVELGDEINLGPADDLALVAVDTSPATPARSRAATRRRWERVDGDSPGSEDVVLMWCWPRDRVCPVQGHPGRAEGQPHSQPQQPSSIRHRPHLLLQGPSG